MEIEARPDELYHYGRLGMKWGKHIFGKDKTASGKRRKNSRTDQGEDDSQSKRSVDGISSEDLKKRTDRLTAEKNYFDAERNRQEAYNKLYPKAQPKSKESFAKKFMDEAVKPALVEVGKKQITNYLNTKVEQLTKGKIKPGSIEALKKEHDEWSLKSKISTAKKVVDQNDKYFKEEQEKADRKAAAQKQVDDYNNSGHKDDIPGNNRYSKSGDDLTDPKISTGKSKSNRILLEQIDRINTTGKDVEGAGTSRFSEGSGVTAFRDAVYDGEKYVDRLFEIPGPVSEKATSTGEWYVGQILGIEDKQKSGR